MNHTLTFFSRLHTLYFPQMSTDWVITPSDQRLNWIWWFVQWGRELELPGWLPAAAAVHREECGRQCPRSSLDILVLQMQQKSTNNLSRYLNAGCFLWIHIYDFNSVGVVKSNVLMFCYQLRSMWGIRVKENGVMFSCMLTLSIFDHTVLPTSEVFLCLVSQNEI